MTEAQVARGIEEARKKLSVSILGHHYQRQDVVDHCDFLGDSLELSRRVADIDARHIVFCGVLFMAESAALLARPGQTVHSPALDADCVMARMVPAPLLERVLTRLERQGRKIFPLAYVNTSLDVKAVVGRHGGAVCTSANAEKMLSWALNESEAVLFLPDANLARNTARKIGLDDSAIHTLDIRGGGEALDLAAAARARLLCWPGFCTIHARFKTDQIASARREDPRCQIIVHPECPPDVVAAADAAGSTSFIINFVRQAPEGSHLVIGTEINLVERLAREQAGRLRVDPLVPSACSNMAKVTPDKLFAILQAIEQGTAEGVHVPPENAAPAAATLERMLEVCRK